MNFTHLIRKIICITAACSLPFASAADEPESPQIDLAAAKAELAKARASAQQEIEQKPRKRLFSRAEQDDPESPVAPVAPEIIKASKPLLSGSDEEPETQQATSPKPRRRLFFFGKEKKHLEDRSSEPDYNAGEGTEEPGDEKQGLRRWLFRRDQESLEESEAETPEVAEAAPDADQPSTGGERRRLIGRLFSRNEQDRGLDAQESIDDASAPEVAKQEDGALFGFLLKGKLASGFAKADKTKLGNSLESTPAPAPGQPASKTRQAADALGWYVITESSVPFYAVGLGQPMPPERILDRGSMLTVTKGGWGWCNVRLGSGELGVVSANVMRPATLAEINRHTEPVATADRGRGSRRLFNMLSRGAAPAPELPISSGSEPIRNFGLLPPVNSGE